MIRPLTEKEFASEADASFSRVFQSDDPFGEPFSPSIEDRTILYPVLYELEAHMLNTVVLAGKAAGDNGFYFSVTERPRQQDQDRPYHWFIGFDELDVYHSLGYPFVLENAIYSPQGTWGLLTSHEEHAVAGGDKTFIEILCGNVPIDCDTQIRNFLSRSRDNKLECGMRSDWISKLILHICGKEKGERLLRDSGLD